MTPYISANKKRNNAYWLFKKYPWQHEPMEMYIPDIEGKITLWNDYMEEKARLEKEHKREVIVYVLGDTCDKGPGDLRILSEIKQRTERGERFVLMAGNRNDNKERNREGGVYFNTPGREKRRAMRSFEVATTSADPQNWLRENFNPDFGKLSPQAYCLKESQELFGKVINEQNTEEMLSLFNALSAAKQRIIYYKWMISQTMGAGPDHYTGNPCGKWLHRADELATIRQEEGMYGEITDEMIAQSFYEEIHSPEELDDMLKDERYGLLFPAVLPRKYQGLSSWYNDQSELVEVAGNKLIAHAGLPPGEIDYRQDGTPSNANNDIRKFAAIRNQERRGYIQVFRSKISNYFWQLTTSAKELFNEGAVVLAIGQNANKETTDTKYAHCMQSANFHQNPQTTPENIALLEGNSISTVIAGHQPVGPVPHFVRTGNTIFLYSDVLTMDSRPAKPPMITNTPEGGLIVRGSLTVNAAEVEYEASSQDPLIGRTFALEGETYTIEAKIKDNNNYILYSYNNPPYCTVKNGPRFVDETTLQNALATDILADFKAAVTTGINQYLEWCKPGHREHGGMFSSARHRKEGKIHAEALALAVQDATNLEEAKGLVKTFLDSYWRMGGKYNVHSCASYILKQVDNFGFAGYAQKVNERSYEYTAPTISAR